MHVLLTYVCQPSLQNLNEVFYAHKNLGWMDLGHTKEREWALPTDWWVAKKITYEIKLLKWAEI